VIDFNPFKKEKSKLNNESHSLSIIWRSTTTRNNQKSQNWQNYSGVIGSDFTLTRGKKKVYLAYL
jgi:hypothetical protein